MAGIEPTPIMDTILSHTRLPIPPHELELRSGIEPDRSRGMSPDWNLHAANKKTHETFTLYCVSFNLLYCHITAYFRSSLLLSQLIFILMFTKIFFFNIKL